MINEDGVIKEKGFCFVPALKTVNKIRPHKRKESAADQAGLSTHWDNQILTPSLLGATQATQ